MRACGKQPQPNNLTKLQGQDIGEVIAYRDVEAATAFDHRDDGGDSRSGLLAPDMNPVASADCDDSRTRPFSASQNSLLSLGRKSIYR